MGKNVRLNPTNCNQKCHWPSFRESILPDILGNQ
jgi:hypothetical protein